MHSKCVSIGRGWHPLVDDHAIESWRNVERFLAAPEGTSIVRTAQQNAIWKSNNRFGCPCSVRLDFRRARLRM